MAPQLARVAHEYGVTVVSSGGFDSLTTKHDMAQKLAEPSIVLHIGDHDPSGVHIFLNAAEDMTALGAQAEFVRLAVTPEQSRSYDLPTAPPKATDRRAFAGNETVQAEAISPPIMAEILRDAIEARMDMDEHRKALDWRSEIRRQS